MGWKFWRCRTDDSPAKTEEPSAAFTSPDIDTTPMWPSFPGSKKEVIALQRLIGNQAVMRLLSPQAARAAVTAFAPTDLRKDQGSNVVGPLDLKRRGQD